MKFEYVTVIKNVFLKPEYSWNQTFAFIKGSKILIVTGYNSITSLSHGILLKCEIKIVVTWHL